MALDLSLGPDQLLLQGNIQRFLSANPRPGWRDLTETLWLGGVMVPETAGGFGGGVADAALVAGELGPALAGADWLSHAMASWLVGQAVPDHAALADLAAGTRRAAILCPASASAMPMVEGGLVRGGASLVAGAAEADLFVIADPSAILLVAADPDRIEQRHRIMHDGSVCADLAFAVRAGDAEVLAAGERALALAVSATDIMLAARAAEAVGLMQRMLADSIAYLGQRQQFGRAIGSFQVLRHRVADMQLAAMKAAALTEVAVAALAAGRSGAGSTVSAACIEVADAVRIVGEGAVQIHGAMGLTEELSLGGHFKRGLAIAAAMGPRADHLARYSELAI